MKKSVYERILTNIAERRYINDLSVDDEDGEIVYADGALDGATVYHMGREGMNAAGEKQMIKAVKYCSAGEYSEADECFAELGKTVRAIGIVDEFQHYIAKNAKRMNTDAIYRSAANIILCSSDVESVKYGLMILEMFQPDEDVKIAIRRLGLCDEFTIFAVWNMLNWDNGNDEVFALAQKVYEWGRIHAVERLEPETEEIKEWLLLEGINNNVAESYSALKVWNNAEVCERLNGPLSEEEFHCIGKIIEALIDESARPGISAIDDPEEPLLKYLSFANEFDLNIDDYGTIFELCKWAADDDVDLPEISQECAELLTTELCRGVVLEAVKKGEGLSLAKDLGVDYAEDLFRCIAEDFDNRYGESRHLTELEDYLEPVLDLFREKLPLEKMMREPTADYFFMPDFRHYSQLEAILSQLEDHPGVGEDLVAAGLWSPGVKTRSTAVYTLLEWTKAAQQPIEEISERLFCELKKLLKKEVDPGIRKQVQSLVDGIVMEEEDEDD